VAKRGSLLLGVAVAFLGAVAIGVWFSRAGGGPLSPPDPTETEHPSILLVTIDTLRADHCSAYGYARPTTPRLDALAERGVRFAAAYAPMASTAPSHATMFTSLLPRAHGMLKNGQVLPARHRRLAEVMRDNGYLTAAFVSSFAVNRRFGFGEGFATYDDDFTGAHTSHRMSKWEGQSVPEFFDRRADETRPRVLDWLRSHGYLENARAAKPFFVWVHLFDPHEPYDPPSEDRARIRPDSTGDALQRAIANYDAEIRFADREMGAIFDALEAAGRFDEVLTIVVGDHGEGLMQHGHMYHGVLIYEETVRVPLVFHWPSRLSEPLVIEEPVEVLDLAPTLLELAGLAPLPQFQGTSLAGVMRGQAVADPERPIFLERREFDTPVVDGFRVIGNKFGLRQGRWKYIEAKEEGTHELYDLANDPHERSNLFETRPDESATLARVLHVWIDGSSPPSVPAVSPEDARGLRELGYVQ
jgi:arylsulfatase A-like enzyme